MAVEEVIGDVGLNAADLLSAIPGIDLLVKATTAAAIIIVVYVLYLLIRGIAQWKYTRRIKALAKDVSEINKKLDVLVKGKNKATKRK
jgi:membrane protein insertase Oxa1/YidC/SpoIIIJ